MTDLTYVATWPGFVFVAFLIDVFSRRIVGWRVSTSMKIGLVRDALEQTIHARGKPGDLIHHSDRGSQYLSIRYRGGRQVKEVCREYGISDATYYNWKGKYGNMEASDLKRLKELEDENRRLKHRYAELNPDHKLLKDIVTKKL